MSEEQLEIDFEVGRKADLILYLSNALRHAAADIRSENPRAPSLDVWDSLAEEGLEYALSNDVHRQTFNEIISRRCEHCQSAILKDNYRAAATIGDLERDVVYLRGLLRRLVRDCDEDLGVRALPAVLRLGLDGARVGLGD